MADRKLGLPRDQLALFLKTHEQIKQFENLFLQVNESTPLAVDGAYMAETAQASANEALAQLQRIADTLEVIAAAPVPQHHNSVVTDYIDLPDDAPHITQARRLQWNPDDGTLDVGIYNGEVLQIGEELVFYSKNTSGGLITKGTPVMFDGALGASGKLKFTKAVADGSVQSDYMMGVAMHDVENNAFGYVTSFGVVRGFDTTGTPYGETWADGDTLYFGAASPGTWTNVAPIAPAINVRVAVVVHASAGSGSIFVRMKTSTSLNNLQDVYINGGGPQNYDIITYDAPNQRWHNVRGVTRAKGRFVYE